jgi:hypothetical protein
VSAHFPEVAFIGDGAFAFTGLTAISLPASLTEMGMNPFVACIALTDITIDAGNQDYKVENGMLLSKNGETLIGWPAASGSIIRPGIITIGDFACLGTGLTEVNFPHAVEIGNSAFMSCEDLEAAYFPSAETVGGAALSSCPLLVTLDLSSAETLGYGAIEECDALVSVDLPNAKILEGQVFNRCTSLESVNLPSVTKIGSRSFSETGGTSLEVTLGLAAPEVVRGVFMGVDVPKTVTVRVPAGADYSEPLSVTYSGGEKPGGPFWGEGFRGKGWPYDSSNTVNSSITLTIEEYTP